MKIPGFDWTRAEYHQLFGQSSFGPGALLLDRRARADLEVLYAFCRAIDDCADDYPPIQARRFLLIWKRTLEGKGGPELAVELRALFKRHGLDPNLWREIIRGALSDLRPKVRFRTRAQLAAYCRRVAGCVGLACLPIFGMPAGLGRDYAEALGRALQLINILRDAAEDAGRGRIYFALADLRRHGITEEAALRGEGMLPVLEEYAEWALAELRRADQLALALPRRALRPSLLMRRLYGGLLEIMRADGLKVYEKRYRLPWWRKAWMMLWALR